MPRSQSSLDSDASKRTTSATHAETRGPWLSAKEVFLPGSDSTRDSFLTFYESLEGRRRSFGGRCGTSLAFAIFPVMEGWPEMLDIVLGTVDRENLEGNALVPERQLW